MFIVCISVSISDLSHSSYSHIHCCFLSFICVLSLFMRSHVFCQSPLVRVEGLHVWAVHGLLYICLEHISVFDILLCFPLQLCWLIQFCSLLKQVCLGLGFVVGSHFYFIMFASKRIHWCGHFGTCCFVFIFFFFFCENCQKILVDIYVSHPQLMFLVGMPVAGFVGYAVSMSKRLGLESTAYMDLASPNDVELKTRYFL